MPDPVQTSTSSMQLSLMPHNMSNSHGKAQAQKKPSRLEMIKLNYEKKRQQTVQQKRNEFETNTRTHSGGTVRAFFAERRAMEASAKEQDSSAYLPPIEAHFRKMKHQTQPSGFQSSPQKTLHEVNPPPAHQDTVHRNNSGTNRYHRKKSKGIDKQNPLPPLQKDRVNPHKPPTPNRRYETHAALIANEEEDFETSHPVRVHQPVAKKRGKVESGPVIPRGASKKHVPQPPPKQRTAALNTQKRILKNLSQNNEYDDDDNDETYHDNWSTHTDEPPPNLAKLKALRMKRLSQQQTSIPKEDKKLTDFQKWQIQQDNEREERLENHRKKQAQKSEVSLSMREKELLERIQQEQERLNQIKKQQEELEEQERVEKEEEEIFNRTFKKSDFNMKEKEEVEQAELVPKRIVKKESANLQKKPTRSKPPPPPDPEPEEMETEDHKDYTSFYIQEAERDSNAQEVLNLVPCLICGRNFQEDRLERHQKICQKSSKSKRKVFNTVKHRVAGMEHEKYIDAGAHKQSPEKKAHKADWRTQHQNFIKAIRYAKGDTNEPPPVMENPHYVQCPHCERKFNPETAERHIPRCKDIKARPAPPKAKRKK